MSRRVKRPLAKRATGGRPKGAKPYRDRSQETRRHPEVRAQRASKGDGVRPSFEARLRRAPQDDVRRSSDAVTVTPDRVEPPPLPTKVQTVVVTADEANMRVDRFLESRFPGLSFSHIQRIVRKGELRVNGKRTDSKDRLTAGQAVRIPPLHLDAPKK